MLHDGRHSSQRGVVDRRARSVIEDASYAAHSVILKTLHAEPNREGVIKRSDETVAHW
jgi:hypothetical protein